MDSTNSILLNRFFTRNTFRQVIDDGQSQTYTAAISRYVEDYQHKTGEECVSTIYQILKNEYQNEYYYKNTLLNKLLLGIHNPRTTTALTEIPVGNSKADFVLINGKAVVYEIKTALDNFDRLDGQIEDYFKAFSRVVVVVPEKKYDVTYQKFQNTPVGIYALTEKNTFSNQNRKEPTEYCDILSKIVMFKILRKNEHERIIKDCFGKLPNVSQFEYYKECQKIFESLPTDKAYDKFIETIKLRSKIDIVEYADIPYELKFLIYFSNYKKSDYEKLRHFLETKEAGV